MAKKTKPKAVWRIKADKAKLALVEKPATVEIVKPKEKIFKYVRKVDKKINEFTPTVVCVVALDPEHCRVMVRPEKWVACDVYDRFIMELDGLAHKFALRLRGEDTIKEHFHCDHPTWRRVAKNVTTGSRSLGFTKEWRAFCTKCGADLGKTDRPQEYEEQSKKIKARLAEEAKPIDKSGPKAPRTVKIRRKP